MSKQVPFVYKECLTRRQKQSAIGLLLKTVELIDKPSKELARYLVKAIKHVEQRRFGTGASIDQDCLWNCVSNEAGEIAFVFSQSEEDGYSGSVTAAHTAAPASVDLPEPGSPRTMKRRCSNRAASPGRSRST